MQSFELVYLFIISLFFSSCYGYIGVSTLLSWSDAEIYCLATYGSHLASIASASEHSEVYSVCNAVQLTEFCWIGFTDQSSEGSWTWTDDTPVSYTLWGPI
eukprot:331918_1